MGIIKKILLVIFIAVGITAGVVVATRYIPQESWNGVVVGPAKLQPLIASSLEHVKGIQILNRMKVLQGKVLGANEASSSSTEASSSAVEASLPQKTLDYAMYTYCKAVVEEYERK